MRRKICISLVLVLIMMATGIVKYPSAAYAEEPGIDGTIDLTGMSDMNGSAEDGGTNDSRDLFTHSVTSLQDLGMATVSGGAASSSYRSPYVTKVKRQSPYETCWAFSGAAAIEANLVKKGIASSSVDVSEWQLAYYTYHTAVDPMGLTKGDTITASDYLKNGGNQFLMTSAMANWKGVTSEKKAPYKTVVDDPTAALSQKLAYASDLYHLENAYWIAYSDRDQIKQAIVKYGAVVTNYYHDMYYLNHSTGAYYCPTRYNTSHGVAIVGWDDNYKRTNFSSYQPSSDGAWLCKNSWGSDWGNDGYFWLSYEEASMDNNVYAYDMAKADNYQYNYQYDGTFAMVSGFMGTSSVYTANVYHAAGNQTIKAVGYYSYDTMYSTSVMIYKNPSDSQNPASGTLMTSRTVTDTFAGYHTLTLDTPVNVRQGDVFSVVVRQESPNGAVVRYYMDYSYQDASVNTVSHAEAGQSFVSAEGSSWVDMGSKHSANLRIKAFADDTPKTKEEKNAEAFATRLYNECLGRQPDAAGLEHWTTVLVSRERTGSSVAYGFIFSKEYLNKNTSDHDYITMLYKVMLDRKPDPSGYDHWSGLLEQGLSREYVFRGFAESKEFTGICTKYGIDRGNVELTQPRDQNPNLTRYISRLYTNVLGRSYDVDGINHWCDVIRKKARTPEEVAEAFVKSPEFQRKKLSDEEYVKVLYRTFLGREYDQAGLDHWIHELKRGCSRDEILHRFAVSAEYKRIQATFGL